MKKLLFLLFLSIVSYTSTYAQDPIVIKQDSSVRDLDEEQDVRDLPFRQRLRFGGGINGGTFTSYGINIGVSPMVGYQVRNNTIVGVGLTYNYNSVYSYGKLSQFGQRAFIRQGIPVLEQLLGRGFLIGQVENYTELSSSPIQYTNPVLVGIGIGAARGFNLTVMYDLNYQQATASGNNVRVSPYGSALVVQLGGFFF
jgi:hypothetical protein